MLKSLINRIIVTRFEREMKKLQPIVDEIHRHEERLAELDEEELKAQTERFRERIQERTEALEEEIAELRDRRQHTEEPATRQEAAAPQAETGGT